MPARKRLVVTQSNYIPWKGYFDAIRLADELVLLDSVQYTRRDWRNRNRIKTANGLQWLTIPVGGPYEQRIEEARIADARWGERHWRSLSQAYAAAPYFEYFAATLEELYLRPVSNSLSEVNRSFIEAICGMLGINRSIRWSREFPARDGKSERLLDICQALGATEYWSGPSAQAYLDEALFSAAGIEVRYFDYAGYPPYPQLHGDFVHEVSVLDLIFNTGPESLKYFKSHKE